MRTVQTSLLAGAAMIVFAGVAQAQNPGTHVLTIHLPGGGVEQIRYSGDTPPEVFLGLGPALAEPPELFAAFGSELAFAALDRISEEMNRRAARLLEQVEQADAMTDDLPAGPGQLIQAHSGSLPPNMQGYTFVSAMSANGVCSRSVEITSLGDGREPKVEKRSYGRCGSASHAAVPRSMSTPPRPKHRPVTIMANAQSSAPRQAAGSGMMQEAAWRP